MTVDISGPPSGVRWSGLYKSAGAVISVVLLGAIGSGIWDLALSPGVDWAVNRLLRVASWTYDGFADFLYRRVSRDPHNAFARLPYVFVMSSLIYLGIVAPVLLIRRLSRLRTSIVLADTPGETNPEEIVANVDRYRKTIARVMLPVAGISSVLYLGMMFQDIHANEAAIFVERSIEILAPHVDGAEVLRLRASFRSIETAQDFYTLEAELRESAARKDVTLPEFTSIR